MKSLLSLLPLILSCLTIAQVNPNYTHVEGYYRSNGTYVKPHYRTLPNQTINDNYSTKPNINPHTGQSGYISPKPICLPRSSTNYLTPSNPLNNHQIRTYSELPTYTDKDKLFDNSRLYEIDAMLDESKRKEEGRKWEKEQEEYQERVNKETQETMNRLKSKPISYNRPINTGFYNSSEGKLQTTHYSASNHSNSNQENTSTDKPVWGYFLCSFILLLGAIKLFK